MSYLQNSIAPKWNIYVSFVLKGSPSFYKGFDQTFTNIRAVSRSHHFELMAAAMAKIVKKTVPGCATMSTVTRRSDKGARRSNSGNASSRSRSSSNSSVSGDAMAVSVAAAAAVAGGVAAAVAAASESSHSKSQEVTASHSSNYQHQHQQHQHQHQQQLHQQQQQQQQQHQQQQQQSRWRWCCWCFAGAGKTNACSKSRTRPRSGNGSCRSSSRMGKKVCQLLAMPSCLSWILPSFLPSFWLRSRTQNQTGKRNRRMRILVGGQQKPDKMQMQQEEKQDRKKMGSTERNEGGKEANRNCHRENMKARKQVKTKRQ